MSKREPTSRLSLSRFSTTVWVVLFAISALALNLVKYQVQSVKDEVVSLQRELEEEQRALALLNAEWAFLNRPDRLEKLAAQYLHMVPFSPEAIVGFDDLPMKADELAQQDGAAPAEKAVP